MKSDIRLSPDAVRLPLKAREAVTIDDVIQDLPIIRSMLSQEEDTAEKWQKAVRSFGQEPHRMLRSEAHKLGSIYHTLCLFRPLGGEFCANNRKGHGGSRYTASGIGTTIF